jgi:hypothetical protein
MVSPSLFQFLTHSGTRKGSELGRKNSEDDMGGVAGGE